MGRDVPMATEMIHEAPLGQPTRGAGLGGASHQTRRPWLRAETWLAAAVASILLLLVAGPLMKLLLASFSNPVGSGLTLANYGVAFGRTQHLRALGNSLLLGLGATGLAMIFAVPLAWAVTRTNMPGKGLVRLTVLGTFVTPSYLGAVAWILLASPKAGWLNRLWMTLTGTSTGVIDIYSFAGLVFVVAIYVYPYLFIFASGALEVVSSELEDAASILGARRLRTALRITLPLVLPAICAGAIVTFLDTIALFGTPALIAIPARFSVLTTQLWTFFEYPVQVEVAAAYALPLVLLTALLVAAQRAVLHRRGFAAISGKGGDRRVVELGPWRWVALGYAIFVGMLSVYLPFAIICQAAFAQAWGRGFSVQNLTLRNFRYLIFEYPITQQSVIHTLTYSSLAATACVALGFATAYIVVRRLVPAAAGLGSLAMAPLVIPGIILGMAFYALYAPPPAALNGTAAIVVLAFVARFVPIAYANGSAAMRAVGLELEDAARVVGAARSTTVRRIVAPLLKRPLLGTWLLVFIPAARELSTALFVVGPRTRVLSILMLDLNEEGNFEILAAAGCLLLVVMVTTAWIGTRVVGRDFMLRQ